MRLTVTSIDDRTEHHRVRLVDEHGCLVFEILNGGPDAHLAADGTVLFTTSSTVRQASGVMVRRPNGTLSCLLAADRGEVAFIDERGATIIAGTAAWGREHRMILDLAAGLRTVDLGEGAPWLDWTPLSDERLVVIRENLNDNGIDIVLLDTDGTVVAQQTQRQGIFRSLKSCPQAVVVTLDDLDDTGHLLRLSPWNLAIDAHVTLPSRPYIRAVTARAVDLDFDEPADAPRRARYLAHNDTLTLQDPQNPWKISHIAAVSRDGTQVPLEIVTPAGALRALVVISYGCYGLVIERALNPFRCAVLDRGIGYAIVRIRGGGDRGPAWWYGGRAQNKHRAVDDLCAALDHLRTMDVPLVGRSFSAGCTLQLAATMFRPAALRGLILHSPLLRLLDTDEEFSDEWGNKDQTRSLCPTSQASALKLPDTLMTGGLLDVRTPVSTISAFLEALPHNAVRDRLAIELGAYRHNEPPMTRLEDAAVRFLEDVVDGCSS